MKYVLLMALLLGMPCWAALPPQTPSELRKAADNVLIGTVTKIETRIIQQELGADKIFVMTFMVDEQTKGALSSSSVHIECWQSYQRPDGFTGPQGQNEVPRQGDKIRVYLKQSTNGTLQLLEPNGWEKI